MINVHNDKNYVMKNWNPQTLDKSKQHELCDDELEVIDF